VSSRFKKTMTKPREIEVCVEVICDLCRKPAPLPQKQGRYSVGVWTTNQYQVNQVLVSREYGSTYPGGHYTTTESFDICPECWKDKLVPWLQSKGATPTLEESED
jgi:hypothetical protein